MPRNPLDNLLEKIVNDIGSDSDSDLEDDLIDTFNHQTNIRPPQPTLGQDNCYEVESILDSRQVGSRTEYLVRWVNSLFPDEWIEQDNINSNLIQRYRLQQQVHQHNNQIQQNRTAQGIAGTSKGKGFVYTRVSDPTKTQQTYQKTCAQQARSQAQTQGYAQSTSMGPGMQSFQSFCDTFATGNFSLSYQKNTGFQYCLENDLEIEMIEMDDGISAKNPDKLPGLQTILANIQPGDYFIFTDFSRFSRHTVRGIQILDDLHSRGIYIRSVLDEISYDTPAARHNARQALSNAQFYSELTGQKIKEANQNIRNAGGYIGRLAPFGFKTYRENGLRKIKEKKSEQVVLRFIKSYLYTNPVERGTYANLAEILNRQQHRYRGRPFTNKHIARIAAQIRKGTPTTQTTRPSYLNAQIRREMNIINANEKRRAQREKHHQERRFKQVQVPRTTSKANLSLDIHPMEEEEDNINVDRITARYNFRSLPRVAY